MKGLYGKVAKKVLSETLAVKKGEAVTVESWNNGLEFARTLVAEARAMGCTAALLLEDEESYIEGLRRAPKDRIGVMGRNEYGLISGTDAYVFIPGPLLAAYQRRIEPKLMSDSTKYNSSWYDAAEKAKLRGARLTFGYIGKEMAGVMGRTVQQIVEKQLNAALVDFDDIAESARKLAPLLTDGRDAVVQVSGSRLQLTFKGETTIEDGLASGRDAEAGKMAYVPPGFVSSDVDPTSASGTLTVSKTLTRLGLLNDAELTFKEGRLVKWKSRGSMPILTELIEAVSEQNRRMTILNVGINPKMGYLFGQDRMVAGSVTAGGFGFLAVMRAADLMVGGEQVVKGGKL